MLILLLVASAATQPASSTASTVFGQRPVAYRHFIKTSDLDYPVISDVVEIVPVDADRAYVRAHVIFAKGHICGISGIARQQSNSLVYEPPLSKLDVELGLKQCTFEIEKIESGIVLHDRNEACRTYCGARGMFEGIWFSDRAKRQITYIDRLRASPPVQ